MRTSSNATSSRTARCSASYRAAEIAEERRQACLASALDFVSESTFSHPSKLSLIDDAIAAEFRVVLYHVNVRSADLSVKRVASRMQEGGHDVPEDKIRERYLRNRALIGQAMLKVDVGLVYDNSRLNAPPTRVIDFANGSVIWVAEHVPDWARELYATQLDTFEASHRKALAASVKPRVR